MNDQNKPQPPMTHKQRPAGTIVINPGDDEDSAWENLRRDNEAARQAEESSKNQKPPAPVTTSDEEEE